MRCRETRTTIHYNMPKLVYGACGHTSPLVKPTKLATPMTRPNITPGPWFVSRKNQSRVIASGPKAETLARAFAKGVTAEIEKRESEANARAIAALPDLLRVLEQTYETHQAQSPVKHCICSFCQDARVVLRKSGYEF